VIDGQLVTLLFIREALEEVGYDATEAPDGENEIELCRQSKFDLIVTDILMPEKDGMGSDRIDESRIFINSIELEQNGVT
jgi:CheY-like chemotaxis protein